MSASAKDLLHKLLDIDPKVRITADQAINHPWVLGRSATRSYLASPGHIGQRRKELMSPKISLEDKCNRIRGEGPLESVFESPEGKGGIGVIPKRKNSF